MLVQRRPPSDRISTRLVQIVLQCGRVKVGGIGRTNHDDTPDARASAARRTSGAGLVLVHCEEAMMRLTRARCGIDRRVSGEEEKRVQERRRGTWP